MMHVPSCCFANLNRLLFCRFCCRLRHGILKSVLICFYQARHWFIPLCIWPACRLSIPFTCALLAYLRKTLHESIKIFVEPFCFDIVSGPGLLPTSPVAFYSGLVSGHRFINKWMLALKNTSLKE